MSQAEFGCEGFWAIGDGRLHTQQIASWDLQRGASKEALQKEFCRLFGLRVRGLVHFERPSTPPRGMDVGWKNTEARVMIAHIPTGAFGFNVPIPLKATFRVEKLVLPGQGRKTRFFLASLRHLP